MPSAGERFFDRLAGLTDPEDKRKAIGELFIRLFEERGAVVSVDARFLVQGTLYPDVIESGTATAAKIKSHHNVGGLPDDIEFALVEPLRLLFKDEVRALGTELGLPDEIVWRQPFPGRAWRVRIVGEVTDERGLTRCGRPMPSCARNCASPGWTARSGRRSRCWRLTCDRWGSWATSAPTAPDHRSSGHLRGRDDRRLGPHPL
jgi:hypothetical protein